jgi:hypothetical protein
MFLWSLRQRVDISCRQMWNQNGFYNFSFFFSTKREKHEKLLIDNDKKNERENIASVNGLSKLIYFPKRLVTIVNK